MSENEFSNPQRRCIVVSNRLPRKAVKVDGRVKLSYSVGGLATGMESLLEGQESLLINDYVWFGESGLEPECADLHDELKQSKCVCAAIPGEEAKAAYTGFMNQFLWPMLHQLPEEAAFDPADWERYRQYNEAFRDAILPEVQEGDIIWIHDYQLFLLPGLLREVLPEVRIGFFLHTPFANAECLHTLPQECRRAILHGVLGANLVGFHTSIDVENFSNAVRETLNMDAVDGAFVEKNRRVQLKVYPMSIDYNFFSEFRESKSRALEKIPERRDLEVILSVDRLDYTKGILERLEGLKYFLERHPEWIGRVQHQMIVAPNREEIRRYRILREEIEMKVDEINRMFALEDWIPVNYRFEKIEQEEVIALYRNSDIGLITPLRDGMNLVAKEFIAAQQRPDRILILSGKAGAAQELQEALIIDPQSREQIAKAIFQALEMRPNEKEARLKSMQEHLQRKDVFAWGKTFLKDLIEGSERSCTTMDAAVVTRIAEEYRQAKRRLFLLDYDGTLAAFAPHPNDPVPSEYLKGIIAKLAQQPHTDIVIVSGRDKKSLHEWFKSHPIQISAEYGVWRFTGKEWLQKHSLGHGWKSDVRELMESFLPMLTGASIQEKTYALCWHDRAASPTHRDQISKELASKLQTVAHRHGLQVIVGSRVIEVMPRELGKSQAIQPFLEENPADFILVIGDDVPDEQMFQAAPQHSYTIKVGSDSSCAKYRLSSPAEVLNFLDFLSETH